MPKMRVYQLAKELQVQSALVLELLDRMGQDVRSDLSVLDTEIADLVRDRVTRAIATERRRLEKTRKAEAEAAKAAPPSTEPQPAAQEPAEESKPAAVAEAARPAGTPPSPPVPAGPAAPVKPLDVRRVDLIKIGVAAASDVQVVQWPVQLPPRCDLGQRRTVGGGGLLLSSHRCKQDRGDRCDTYGHRNRRRTSTSSYHTFPSLFRRLSSTVSARSLIRQPSGVRTRMSS